jgi:hypothetical protein
MERRVIGCRGDAHLVLLWPGIESCRRAGDARELPAASQARTASRRLQFATRAAPSIVGITQSAYPCRGERNSTVGVVASEQQTLPDAALRFFEGKRAHVAGRQRRIPSAAGGVRPSGWVRRAAEIPCSGIATLR